MASPRWFSLCEPLRIWQENLGHLDAASILDLVWVKSVIGAAGRSTQQDRWRRRVSLLTIALTIEGFEVSKQAKQ